MRVAVVTGAARGIGAATVQRLVDEGWSVVAVDACEDDPAVGYPMARREELDALVRADGRVRAVVADVRDLGALQQAVDIAVETYGGLDAAFAVAGVIACGGGHRATAVHSGRAGVGGDVAAGLHTGRRRSMRNARCSMSIWPAC